MTKQEAEKLYREMKERIQALEMKDRILIDTIEAVDTGEHCIDLEETLLIADVYRENPITSAYRFFQYGFLKGLLAAEGK